MKTLREYIDQLDEISRRDFLKGAGATAGLAAMGASQPAMSEENYGQIVYDMLWLYEICKGDNWNSTGQYRNFCPQVKNSVQKFASRNDMGPMGKTSGKLLLNSWYKKVISDMQSIQQSAPGTDGLIALGSARQRYINNAKEIIRSFNSLLEFNESVVQEEELDENGNPDAVARILELSKNK
jgi:TAT (twin-arginine translocation) pathway signal sequence